MTDQDDDRVTPTPSRRRSPRAATGHAAASLMLTGRLLALGSARSGRLTRCPGLRSVLRPHPEEEGRQMPEELHPTLQAPSSLAAAGFQGRYREPTVGAHRNDLRCFWTWCAEHDLEPLQVRR
jgi:hypothetical protein